MKIYDEPTALEATTRPWGLPRGYGLYFNWRVGLGSFSESLALLATPLKADPWHKVGRPVLHLFLRTSMLLCIWRRKGKGGHTLL